MQNHFFENKIRVRYGETDQMGFVYYGNYALYLEQARTEMLRSVGFTYKAMEKMGVLLPVVNLNIRYKNSAKYDDLLTLKTHITTLSNRKIIFETFIYNEENILLNQSEVILVFMNKEGKINACPQEIIDALAQYIVKE